MSKSCLVVDDSKVIRKVARHILESMAFAVEEAADGQEALTFCRANRPDVILLDWNMPVMSGMEFLGAFNDLDFGIAERPRVVFCTTENSIDHIRAADRKSTRLNSVTNAHLVCRLLLDKKKRKPTTAKKQNR